MAALFFYYYTEKKQWIASSPYAEGKRDPCLFRVPYISNENELKKNNYLGDYLEEVDFDYQLEMGDLQYLNNAALKKQCVIYAVS